LVQIARDKKKTFTKMKRNYPMSVPYKLSLISISLLLTTMYCKEQSKLSLKPEDSLKEHSKHFEKRIESPAPGIHVAIGYGLANSIMLEGPTGLVIIDTMESIEQGKAVLAEFRKISGKPIRAIIYTHNHADHVLGAEAFFQPDQTTVYAHEKLLNLFTRFAGPFRPATTTRSTRMFGNALEAREVENAGIGPFLDFHEESTAGFIVPGKTFVDKLEIEEAGIKLQLIYAPGETDDQLLVYWPKEKAVFCGDNFYWTFPNLYTIRGTPFRSLKQWYKSIDTMRQLNPALLIPSHTGPIKGQNNIEQILQNYRDAIQFIHDQTIWHINSGYTPSQIADQLRLPAHLESLPYLQHFYGKISWSIKSMFVGNLGWFSGDSAELQPLTNKRKAAMMAELAGGEEKLISYFKEKINKGNLQEALEISSALAYLRPGDSELKSMRSNVLRKLAEEESNPNARHYYLSEAMEIENGKAIFFENKVPDKLLITLPIDQFMENLPVNLDYKKVLNNDESAVFEFPDLKRCYRVHIRRGLADVQELPYPCNSKKGELHSQMPSLLYKKLLARTVSPLKAIQEFNFKQGNAISFGLFMSNFELPENKIPYEPDL
jgi:alkyl sulfatase BDS1-like metallo-beta-lactamase superfamily hydrolase